MCYDFDLNPLLDRATDDELMPLVEYLLQNFTNSLSNDPAFLRHPHEPHLYANAIATEIRAMGGNSIVNLFRGRGVSYREVVCDVANRLHLDYDNHSGVEDIEALILYHVFQRAWDRMTPQEREEFINAHVDNFRGQAATMSFQALIRLGGFTSYKVAVIVANGIAKSLLGHGLRLTTNATLTKALSVFVGPIGWVISGIWLAIDLAGPAYRTTIPCVIQVATIRLAQSGQDPDADPFHLNNGPRPNNLPRNAS